MTKEVEVTETWVICKTVIINNDDAESESEEHQELASVMKHKVLV